MASGYGSFKLVQVEWEQLVDGFLRTLDIAEIDRYRQPNLITLIKDWHQLAILLGEWRRFAFITRSIAKGNKEQQDYNPLERNKILIGEEPLNWILGIQINEFELSFFFFLSKHEIRQISSGQ